jgi:hypothetical protein
VEDDVALLPLLVLVAGVLTVSVAVVVARHAPPSRETAVAAGRRHAARTAVAAMGLGIAAAVYVGAAQLGNSAPGGLGVTALLVPITFGVVHTVVLGLGELTWPRPEGEVRRARLVHRGLVDAAPRLLIRAGTAAAALTVVTLVGGALLADPSGRAFSYSSGPFTADASPFPGPFYGIPAGVGLAVLGLLAGAVLWIVANRPAVATGDDRIEAALRRASIHRVLRVTAGVPLFVSGGLLLTAGGALQSVAGSSGGSPTFGPVGAGTAVLALVTMLAGVVACCLPAPSVPVDAPAVPAA